MIECLDGATYDCPVARVPHIVRRPRSNMTVARILAVLLLSVSLTFAEDPAVVPSEKPTPEPVGKELPQPTEKPVPKPVEPPVPGPTVPTDGDKKDDKPARPTTKPVVVPATRPSRRPATRPTSPPQTQASAADANKFPSAREMMAKLADQKKQQEQLAKVAFIDLDKPLSEKPVGFSF